MENIRAKHTVYMQIDKPVIANPPDIVALHIGEKRATITNIVVPNDITMKKMNLRNLKMPTTMSRNQLNIKCWQLGITEDNKSNNMVHELWLK